MDVIDGDGRTPLHLAAEQGHVDVVDALVGQGATVDQVDNKGWSPLHCAVSWNNIVVVESLIGHGASLFLENDNGDTPWIVAAKNCRQGHKVKKYLRVILDECALARAGDWAHFRDLVDAGILLAPFAQWVPQLSAQARSAMWAWAKSHGRDLLGLDLIVLRHSAKFCSESADDYDYRRLAYYDEITDRIKKFLGYSASKCRLLRQLVLLLSANHAQFFQSSSKPVAKTRPPPPPK